MSDNYKSCAVQLYENGYEPLPLKVGEKRPAIKQWSEVDIDSEYINNFSHKMPNAGVGLRGGELVAIDIDVDASHDVVSDLITWCTEHIGLPMIRIGNAPKVALFYRTEQPFGKRDSAHYGSDPEHHQHIEARSLDTQTVAYGIHPDTKQPYTWSSSSTPLNTHIEDLPAVTHEQIDSIYEKFDELAINQCWPVQGDATDSTADSSDWMKGKYEISDVDLIAALGFINADDYHRKIQIGMALYHQFDGDDHGLEMWDGWCQKSSKYNGDTEEKWDTFKQQGRRKTATLGSVLHLAASKGWNNPGIQTPMPEPEFPVQADNTPDLPPLNQFRVDNLWDRTPPKIPWIFKDFMPANKVCMLTAPGGTGKSFFTLQMAFSIATGTPLAGHWTDVTIGPVLLISAEDDVDDMHRRLKSIIATVEDDFAYDATDIVRIKENLKANLRFVSIVGKNAALTHKTGHECEQTKAIDWVVKAVNTMPDTLLTILDPISRFKSGDENNQDDMTKFVNALERIRSETGSGVLAVHHANKASMREGGATEQYAARGASALTDGVRWQANMAKMHPDEAKDYGIKKDQAGNFVQIAVAKTNYTAPFSGVWLNRGLGGVLTSIEIDTFKKKRSDEQIDEVNTKIINIIQRYQDNDKPISPRKLQKDYGTVNGEIGIAQAAVNMHIDKLVADGILELIDNPKVGGGSVLNVVKNDT